jgi:ABC-type transport system involved in multi-copper enzyme maturation permease subunit
MIGCLISVLVVALIAVVVLYVAESAVNAITTLPPPVWHLVRLIVGLIVLLYALQCLGILDGTTWRPRAWWQGGRHAAVA